jgi:hypothetical protein
MAGFMFDALGAPTTLVFIAARAPRAPLRAPLSAARVGPTQRIRTAAVRLRPVLRSRRTPPACVTACAASTHLRASRHRTRAAA